MGRIQDYFYIQTSHDHMTVSIHCSDQYEEMDMVIDEQTIIQYLKENNILFGIDRESIKQVIAADSKSDFPLIVAQGIHAEHGIDGYITYELNFNPEIPKTPDWNFRDVMRIPTVRTGQKLATVTMPGAGENGTDVYGNTVQALPGKPIQTKAGKNVVYHKDGQSFYAASEGQVSVNERFIEIHKVFEVNESLSMKNGNLDFVGSIIIHGDVPTGYTVKAEGDVKVFGMVEAATIIAGGSIFISEGLAGMQKGYIKAGDNIHIGNINQGSVYAGNDLFVESSILHSECTAKNNVYCQKGNIIGGVLSAGVSIEAKDIGNRMSTQTEIVFGVNKIIDKKEKRLTAEKKELEDTLAKLAVIGKKLEAESEQADSKLRITLLRQRNSYKKTADQLANIEGLLEQLNSHLGSEQKAKLIANGHLYPNVMVAFGKYKRRIDTMYKSVQMNLVQNEITIQTL
ncbi:DUF342 domain-containing protein [Virgibacillus oceani]|uniref:Cyclic nucleotide-binding domain-containing protein n=1 Tax=Virgibacillus oceani TaxID=1479511 RepID=A0A917M078_9BACI|nr:FapA family protein [Virgibacillus oceani]GGG68845.1 hypothetical protein GCM10011398_10970 [Virgibacillus oceani]